MDHFVELCAGSAAVTMELLYNSSPIVSYAGSKSGYANAIIENFNIDQPSIKKITLVDPGPWGQTLCVLNDRKLNRDTQKFIGTTLGKNPKEIWSTCKKHVLNQTLIGFEAYHLMTVAGTYGGAEIGGFKGLHKNRPNVDGFIPSRKSIIDRLINIPPIDTSINVIQNFAENITPFKSYCYIDPPYRNSKTKYIYEFNRNSVVKTAVLWDKVGALVMISENEGIEELIGLGWRSIDITNKRKGQLRKNSALISEFITCNF